MIHQFEGFEAHGVEILTPNDSEPGPELWGFIDQRYKPPRLALVETDVEEGSGVVCLTGSQPGAVDDLRFSLRLPCDEGKLTYGSPDIKVPVVVQDVQVELAAGTSEAVVMSHIGLVAKFILNTQRGQAETYTDPQHAHALDVRQG
jgi:hypothetical protein